MGRGAQTFAHVHFHRAQPRVLFQTFSSRLSTEKYVERKRGTLLIVKWVKFKWFDQDGKHVLLTVYFHSITLFLMCPSY